MSKKGPIIIIEDDIDDQTLLTSVFAAMEVKNPLKVFDDAIAAFDYLANTREQPFLIICDINLPKIDGFEFRNMILESEYMRRKSIPFIFLSTSDRREIVDRAYELVVQGFFTKKNHYSEMVKDVEMIYAYWSACRHPNN